MNTWPSMLRRNGGEAAEVQRSSVVGWPAFFLTGLGGSMQGYANGTVDAFLLAISFLAVGFFLVNFVFRGDRPEMRVFLLTYGICVFVGGLAQWYSLATFGNPQSTTDAVNTFFPNINANPPFTTIADMPINFNSRLAVVIWQQVYKLTWLLGLDFGPYIGVMFNAFVMGITGSITVRTARELFGNDLWRLRRVGTLFAFCGLFILFGAVLIRDCFTTFLNALVLWGIIQWLVHRTLLRLFAAIALTMISMCAMVLLRFEVILLFGLFWVIAFLCWYFSKRLDIRRLFAVGIALCILLVASSYVTRYVYQMQYIQTRGIEGYNQQAEDTHSSASLGMRLVTNQPLPIRLIMGSGATMVYPIPLWAFFNTRSADYGWLRGYHGIYQVLILPFVIAGVVISFRMLCWNSARMAPLLFLTVYLFLNLMAVVATSMEQRHLAQFMPAFIILASLPDIRDAKTKQYVNYVARRWFIAVFLVHLAWVVMKGIS